MWALSSPLVKSTEIETGIHVDKDVVLFKDHFDLKQAEATMSPVLFPRGFTRDFSMEK